MALKQNALAGLPKIIIVNPSGDTYSIESFKGAVYKIAEMQKEETAAGLRTVVVSRKNPFTTSTWTVNKGTLATGTVTLATSLADDTVTINGLVYTAVTGAKANDTEYSIDGNDTVDAADLADSINGDVRAGTLNDVTATSALGVVTVSQTVAGLSGNATTLVEDTSGTTIVVSGAVFTGGLDSEIYTLAFVSETISINSDDLPAIPALSSRRVLDIEIISNSNDFKVRSLLSVINLIQDFEDKQASVGKASATVTLATSLAGNTTTINGLVYTAVSGVKADNTKYSIDGNDTVDAADLADSINNDVRAGTVGDVSATSAAGVVTLTANPGGELGNTTTLAEDTSGTTLVISGATFTGGGGNATYSNQSLNGATPFETFNWTITKLASVYTVTPTATS